MAKQTLEGKVSALEVEVARLKVRIRELSGERVPWWEAIWGTFANDPIYEEAMRLGREYRESLRPKPRKRKRR